MSSAAVRAARCLAVSALLRSARCLAFATLLVTPTAASAQERPPDVPVGDARLIGRVVHDERADAGAGVGIILYSLSASGEPGLRQTRADSEGAFRFEGISGDPSVVYLIGTRVAGVPFGERVSFAEGETQREIEIRVSDPSQAVAGVATLEPELLLSRGCSHLLVRHRHPLRNDSERVVYVPPEAREDATPPVSGRFGPRVRLRAATGVRKGAAHRIPERHRLAARLHAEQRHARLRRGAHAGGRDRARGGRAPCAAGGPGRARW